MRFRRGFDFFQIKNSAAIYLRRSVSGFAILGILVSSFHDLLIRPAYANPSGGQVVGGTATISGEGTSHVIVNQGSDRAILNWQDFSVGAGEKTQFVQPGKNSIAFNRVTGADPSKILGSVQANGQVIISNPNGVIFGQGSRVDAAGLVATTHDVNNAEFMAGGNVRFTKNPNAKANASVENHGLISISDAGMAALVAPSVRNTGIISANLGQVALGAGNGFTLDFYGDQLVKFKVGDEIAETLTTSDGQNLKALVDNSGTINARGGQVLLTAAAARGIVNQAVNVTGTIAADSVTSKGGKIILSGGQGEVVVDKGAKLTATGKTTGGDIKVLGREVKVAGATVDVSGKTGGGSIRIGGGYKGGEDLQRAEKTAIDKDTVLKADAVDKGNGGSIVVWSDIYTQYKGALSATGGANGGNGGFAEVSGKQKLDFDGTAMLLAAQGASGTLLLDPRNVIVVDGGGTPGMSCTGEVCTGDGDTSYFGVAGLQTLLATGNVIIETNAAGSANGDVTFVDAVGWSSGNTLTVNAAGNIAINGSINGYGLGTLVLNAGGVATQTAAILVQNLALTGSGTYVLTNAANNVGMLAANAKTVNYVNNGSLTIGTVAGTSGLTMQSGANSISAGTGTITTIDAINAGSGDLTLTSDDINIYADIAGSGNLTLQTNSESVQMRVNYYSGNYDLEQSDLDHLVDGWNSIAFGRADGHGGDLRIGGYTWNDNVIFRGNQQITYGDIIGNASITFDPRSLNDWDRYTQLNADVITNGGNIVFGHTLDAFEHEVKSNNGNITMNAGGYKWGSFNAGLGTITVAGAADVGDSNVRFLSNDVVIADSFTGTGTLKLEQYDQNQAMRINFYGGDYNIDQGEITRLGSTWNKITVGRSNVSYMRILDTHWLSPVEFLASGIETYGTNAFDKGVTFTAPAINGSGRLTTQGGNVVYNGTYYAGRYGDLYSNGGDVTFNGDVYSRGFDTDYTLNIFTDGGDITLNNMLREESDDGNFVNKNVFDAGTGKVTLAGVNGSFGLDVKAKEVDFQGAIGDGIKLGTVNIDVNDTMTLPEIRANNLYLKNNGITFQNGPLTVNNLLLQGSANYSLVDYRNNIGTVAADTFRVDINNGFNDLTVGTVNGVDGITAGYETKLVTTANFTLNKGITTGSHTDNTLQIVAAKFTNNAGASALDAGSGYFRVWSNSPLADNRGGLAYDFKQYNSPYGSALALGTGNGFIYAYAPTITVGLTGSTSKTYDQSVAATLGASNFQVTGGVIDGDVIDGVTASSATYNNANAGSGKSVTASGLSVSGASNGNAVVYGYQVGTTSASANIGTITPRALTVTGGFTANNKVYDRTTGAVIGTSTLGLDDVLSGDDVTLNAVAKFADYNAGNKTVNLLSSTIGGSDSGNYTLTLTGLPTASAIIEKKTLTIGGSFTANDKNFDGSTLAAINSNALNLQGVLGADAGGVALNAVAHFDTAAVGTNKTVSLLNSSISGALLNNYQLSTAGAPTAVASIIGTTTPPVTPQTPAVQEMLRSLKQESVITPQPLGTVSPITSRHENAAPAGESADSAEGDNVSTSCSSVRKGDKETIYLNCGS